ncbi:MAG TPA: beta-N-acetylhexosaminidase [Phycisphaerae bacterium]|jgi:hexosaminidase
MNPLLGLGFCALACAAHGADPPPSSVNVVPRPLRAEARSGEFALTDATIIWVPPAQGEHAAMSIGEYLAACVGASLGLKLRVSEFEARPPASGIVLDTSAKIGSEEGYELSVTPSVVVLRAFKSKPRGWFWGVQTLRQLLPSEPVQRHAQASPWSIPCLYVADQPRYRWRGMLLDCGRHFMSKAVVKRYIDLLAYHKLNVLHWHLTEDQGWRIEIKKYPRLTEIGAWRGEGDQRYGGFYTQAEIREIVDYARSRYVTIVPEIEMPGHCRAALAAYPELSCTGGPFKVGTEWGVYEDVYCAGNNRTFEFLEDVLAEVVELFPSEFVHIGGDECPKTRWQACGKCQARIKAEGLKDEHELQSYFIRRIEKFLTGKHRRLIGWDEILEGGLAPNATVQSWRGLDGAIAAASAGHDVISSPTTDCYFNFPHEPDPAAPDWMGVISLEKAYSFEPTPSELSPEAARHILGAEGNVWTELITADNLDRLAFPRLCALAEVTWSPKELRDWDDFSARMKTHYRRLDALGVKYHTAPSP